MNVLNYILLGTTIQMLCLFSSCNAPEREAYHTVKQKIKANEVLSDTIDFGVSSSDHLQCLKTVMTDSNVLSAPFLIPERQSQIVNFQCSRCHNVPLEEIKNANADEKKAHWNLKLEHAGISTMECKTCHSVNNMDSLRTLTDAQISFNHSYQVCAQCHSKQFKDWESGAHGKQLGGWAPPRVSNSCVNCHNPHNPSFKTRFPARLNTKMLEEQRTSSNGEEQH